MPRRQAILVSSRLSPERMAPYLASCGDDPEAGLALYRWNTELGAAFWPTLADVEVVVRNALHRELTTWSAAEFGEPRWYLDPGRVLVREGHRDIATAQARVARAGRPVAAGRLVAELNFGFWRSLLAARYERSLWRPCLYRAFPGNGRRREVHTAMTDLNLIRNRIAHHEPIHNRPLATLHRTAVTLAAWVCPDTGDWIARHSPVLRLLHGSPYAARVERTHTRLSGPRTAVVWAALREEVDGRDGLVVVDVGGGTGGFAVPLAEAGHRVTVVDASPDALAALTRRAAESGVAGRVRALQGDADRLADLFPPASADLILCHSVLEVVDDPTGALAALAATLRPGGAASIVVANRAAAVLARAMNGHFDAATALVTDAEGRAGPGDKLRRRFDLAGAVALVTAAGLTVEKIHGVRVAADLVPGALADADPDAVLAFEVATADRSPYRDIATQLHLFARRPA